MHRVGLLMMFIVACGDSAKTIDDASPGDDAAADAAADAATDAAIDAFVNDAPLDAPIGPSLAVASDNRILFFSPSDSGNTAPHRVLAGAATMLDRPIALATANGELFVVNAGSITVYPSTASGNTEPLRTIAGPMTEFLVYKPHEIAVANDEVFVVGTRTVGGAALLVFPATANGDVAPIRRIESLPLGISEPSALAVSDDEIFIGSLSEISVYPIDGNGDIAATRSITSTPSLSGASAIDFAGNEMFVVRENFIFAFPRSASGGVTPLRTIAGGPTGLTYDDVEVDVYDDTIYVSNTTGTLLAFPATGSGGISPIRAIYGAATMLQFPASLVVVP